MKDGLNLKQELNRIKQQLDSAHMNLIAALENQNLDRVSKARAQVEYSILLLDSLKSVL